MRPKSEHQTVPLSVLLKREVASEKIDRPVITHGQASESKKGEDFTLLKMECERNVEDGIKTYCVFAVRTSLFLSSLSMKLTSSVHDSCFSSLLICLSHQLTES